MHPLRDTVELEGAHEVEEDFLLGSHEYAWRFLKALAQTYTVWQSMDSQSGLCPVYFQLWRRCLSLVFELLSPKSATAEISQAKSLIKLKKIFKSYKCSTTCRLIPG